MFLNRLKLGAVVWLASCTTALATSKGRIFTPDGQLVYVNVYSTDKNLDQNWLHHFVNVNVLPEIKRIPGVGTAMMLGSRGNEMRIRLNPDLMRANNLSPEDIKNSFRGCSTISSPGRFATKTEPSKEYELTHFEIGRYNKPEQYESIILRASPDGELLRLKDVGQVELGSSFSDISSDTDGNPAAVIVLKQASGSNDVEVIKAVQEKLGHIAAESFPLGVAFQVISPDSRDMVYAVLQTPQDSTLEDTSARCHELGAIARGIDGITSVSSLAGYQIRTEGRDSNVGTCLIHWKDRSDRRQNARQVIEKLQEKCRAMKVNLEFFEPPAISVFVAAGGFSVRILDKTKPNKDRRPGRVPETFLDDLLKRKNLETLFQFFASNYPQSELVINNDVARQKGVSIANAIESRFQIVSSDVQAEKKSQRLTEDFSSLSFKNDRGEMVPYNSFLQLNRKPGLNDTDR